VPSITEFRGISRDLEHTVTAQRSNILIVGTEEIGMTIVELDYSNLTNISEIIYYTR